MVEPIKEEAAPTEKPKKKTVRKKAAKTAAEDTTPSNGDETMTHISSKLAQKLNQNGSKYAKILNRGANGRFVRKVDEPWKNIPETDDASTVMHSRFSLGSIGRR